MYFDFPFSQKKEILSCLFSCGSVGERSQVYGQEVFLQQEPRGSMREPLPCYSETGLFAVESAAKYLGISLPLFSCVDLSLSSQAECPEDDITLSAI